MKKCHSNYWTCAFNVLGAEWVSQGWMTGVLGGSSGSVKGESPA